VDPEVASYFGVDLGALDRLERRILDDYEPEQWGIGRFTGIVDVVQRAVASDLLISLCEGAKTALLDLAMASARYTDLLGPNGRTMPGPETTIDDRVEVAQLDATSTECFRALGSALDCLAGLGVLMIGLPLSVQRAEGSWLLRTPSHPDMAPRQQEAWDALVAVVASHADDHAPGWLAWSLETRNAVIHRGQLLRLWLNRPRLGSTDDPQFIVRTNTPIQYLVRVEPHLRRRPWLPDMHALTSGGDLSELWLIEPAHMTLDHLKTAVAALAEQVAVSLSTIWDTAMIEFEWPAASWQLEPRESGRRIDLADRFRGFVPTYPVPPPAEIRMHADSAKRPALAERLRRRPG
jgi:hypothetical protein